MKKIIILILALCFVLCGCYGNKGSLIGITSSQDNDTLVSESSSASESDMNSKTPYTDPKTGITYDDITEHPEYSNIDNEYYVETSHGSIIDLAPVNYFEDDDELVSYLKRISNNPAETEVLKDDDEDYYYVLPEIYKKIFDISDPNTNRRNREPILEYRCYNKDKNDDNDYSAIWFVKKYDGSSEYFSGGKEIGDGVFSHHDDQYFITYLVWVQDGYLFQTMIPDECYQSDDDLIKFAHMDKVRFRD